MSRVRDRGNKRHHPSSPQACKVKANARFPATLSARYACGRTPRVLKTCPEMTYAQSTAPHCIAQAFLLCTRSPNCSVLFHSIFMYSCTQMYIKIQLPRMYVTYCTLDRRRDVLRDVATGYYSKTSSDRNVFPSPYLQGGGGTASLSAIRKFRVEFVIPRDA